jgi:hypothetical protein
MAINQATEDNITLELEHEVPLEDTSHNPSPFQPLAVEPDPEINAAGRVVRKKRLTWKLLQQLPAPPSPLPEPLIAFEDIEPIPEALIPSCEIVWRAIKTTCNSFGLYREYPNVPSHNPDNTLSLLNLVDDNPPTTVNETESSVSTPLSLPTSDSSSAASYFPFKNSTIFGMMNWMWTGSSMKSIGEMKKLVEFLKSDGFKKEDLATFDIHSETMKFDNYLERPVADDPESRTGAENPQDGWHESEVIIQVPDGKPHSKDNIPTFKVPGLHHRSLVDVIKTAFSDPASTSFHYMPFKSFWKDPSTPESVPQRVYDELYASDAMIEAHTKLQQANSNRQSLDALLSVSLPA